MIDINSLLNILTDNWQIAAGFTATAGGSVAINSAIHNYLHSARNSEYLTEFRSGFGRLVGMFKENKPREYMVGYVHGFDFSNDRRHRLYEPNVKDREQYAEGFMEGIDKFKDMESEYHYPKKHKRDKKAFYDGMLEASLQVKGRGYLGD